MCTPDGAADRPVEALRHISENVTRARTIGFFGGCGASAYVLWRMKSRPSQIRSIVITLLGGLAGSFFLLPFGVSMSRSYIRQVEDPNHFTRVLKQGMERRQRDGSDPRQLLENPTAGPPPPRSLTAQDGTDVGQDSTLLASDPAAFGGTPPPASDADWSSFDSAPPTQPQRSESGGAPAGSRWEQLRRDRTGNPSVWEQIRQQRARDNLPEDVPRAGAGRSGAGGPSGDAGAFSSQPPPQYEVPRDNPDSVKARYERAEREYQAAFERERKGVDGIGGETFR